MQWSKVLEPCSLGPAPRSGCSPGMSTGSPQGDSARIPAGTDYLSPGERNVLELAKREHQDTTAAVKRAATVRGLGSGVLLPGAPHGRGPLPPVQKELVLHAVGNSIIMTCFVISRGYCAAATADSS